MSGRASAVLLFVALAACNMITVLSAPLTDPVTPDALFAYQRETFPSIFCAPDMYFRKCFSLSEYECQEAVGGGLDGCISGLKKRLVLPSLYTKDQAIQVGGYLGSCIGAAFEKILSERHVNSEYCNDLRSSYQIGTPRK
jgi:hypothetical protein